jgi:hypothetical protein
LSCSTTESNASPSEDFWFSLAQSMSVERPTAFRYAKVKPALPSAARPIVADGHADPCGFRVC